MARAKKKKAVGPDPRRALPQVERLVRAAQRGAGSYAPDALWIAAARKELEQARRRAAKDGTSPGLEQLAARVCRRVEQWERGTPRVLNATGTVLHTNLGRAPLSEAARRRLFESLNGYSALEFDLESGRRSLRGEIVEEMLCALTGAEAALVVNNNAAAVLLALSALASGRPALVSRGELIEIGGSYRLPEVFEKSGVLLREVGTTNRTHLRDYERHLAKGTSRKANTDRPALVVRVHPSNYRTVGFTTRPTLRELSTLCRKYRTPLVEDLGSGCLVDLSDWGLEREPTVQDSIREGADLVTWSGDKLLGGPQAGILLGKRKLVNACRADPLARALRVDKLTLAALEATLVSYFDTAQAARHVPVLRLLGAGEDEVRARADRLAAACASLPDVTVETRRVRGEVGGGSLPTAELVSWAVGLRPARLSPEALDAALRAGRLPVVARVQRGCVWLDARTLLDEQDGDVVDAIRAALDSG